VKVSRLKKVLSYLFPVKIWKGSSAHHPVLELFLHNGRWQLTTPDAIYSDGIRYRPLVLAFGKIKDRLHRNSSVLFLGAGIGSGVQILHDMGFSPASTLVDNDPEVLRLAQAVLPTANNRFVCADAASFITSGDASYDLIVVDIFTGRVVPAFVTTFDFLEACKQRINPGGMLILNYMINSKAEEAQYRDLTTDLLPDAQVIEIGINKVLIATV